MSDLEVRKFEDLPKSKQDVYKKKMLKQKVEGAGEKIKEVGKKVLEFTPPGQIKKLVDFVKDKTKKKTGIDVNKGDNQKDIKVNTGNNNSSAGSSNPKRSGAKFGGRAMYKSGMRVCKLAKRGKGRAYGKNS